MTAIKEGMLKANQMLYSLKYSTVEFGHCASEPNKLHAY